MENSKAGILFVYKISGQFVVGGDVVERIGAAPPSASSATPAHPAPIIRVIDGFGLMSMVTSWSGSERHHRQQVQLLRRIRHLSFASGSGRICP